MTPPLHSPPFLLPKAPFLTLPHHPEATHILLADYVDTRSRDVESSLLSSL